MNNQILNKLRTNLTVMNTMVLIGLSVFIAVVFFVTSRISRDAEINNILEAYSAQLAGETAEKSSKDLSGFKKEKSQYEDFNKALEKNAVTYVIWNETFEPISGSSQPGLATDLLKKLIMRYVSDKQLGYWIANYQTSDTDVRVCTYTYVSEQGAMRTVQVIKDMSNEQSSRSGSVGIMFFGIVISAGASALCGYFLSGKALIPIRENMDHQRDFMANASHELRTPIAVIRTNLEVVMDNETDRVEHQLEWLDNAYKETQRIQHIVEDMMFLARADSGELKQSTKEVDVDFLCAEVTERMMPIAAAKSIMLIADTVGETLMVEGDENLLTQLLVILIDNAIKYSESGSRVQVSCEKNELMAMIRVQDNGIGIAPEEQEKIFQRFYRVDKARSRAEGGTGLGLSIAQWIVSIHEGEISVSGEEGKGTTMTVLLPLVKPELTENESKEKEII